MRVNWNQVIEELTFILGMVVVGAFIITAGWFIGSSHAHSTRVSHEFQIACIEQGGTLIEMDDEKVCVKK